MHKYYLIILLFLIWGCSDSSSFKFALFSDTHINENSTAIEDLQQVVKDVNGNSEIEFVLVSGDITEINTGKNLEIAKSVRLLFIWERADQKEALIEFILQSIQENWQMFQLAQDPPTRID